MRSTKTLVVAIAAALMLALPATSLAAGPSNATLAKQVKALNKKVTALQTRLGALDGAVTESSGAVGQLQSDNDKQEQEISFVNDKDTCTTAITWDGLDLIVNYLTGQAPARLDDKGACARVGITRTGSPAALAHGSTGAFGGLVLMAEAVQHALSFSR